MNPFIVIAGAGLVGALAMMVVIWIFQAIGLTSSHLLDAIGSLVTKRLQGASRAGLIIHLVSGVVFAFIYVLVWSYLDLKTMPQLVLLGMITGFLHALAVSIAIVILVAEHHPIRRYHKVGFNVALTQVICHIVFGLVVGTSMGYFEQKDATMTSVSQAVWPTIAH